MPGPGGARAPVLGFLQVLGNPRTGGTPGPAPSPLPDRGFLQVLGSDGAYTGGMGSRSLNGLRISGLVGNGSSPTSHNAKAGVGRSALEPISAAPPERSPSLSNSRLFSLSGSRVLISLFSSLSLYLLACRVATGPKAAMPPSGLPPRSPQMVRIQIQERAERRE